MRYEEFRNRVSAGAPMSDLRDISAKLGLARPNNKTAGEQAILTAIRTRPNDDVVPANLVPTTWIELEPGNEPAPVQEPTPEPAPVQETPVRIRWQETPANGNEDPANGNEQAHEPAPEPTPEPAPEQETPAPANEAPQQEDLRISVNNPPTVRAGVPYHFTPEVAGAIGTLTWSARDLPRGLSVNSQTGEVHGTWNPHFWERNFASRRRRARLFARDGRDRVDEAGLTLTLNPAPVPPPATPPDNNQQPAPSSNNDNAGWPWLVFAAAVAMIAFILIVATGDNNGPGDSTAVNNPGANYAAQTFGGNASEWSVIDGSGGSGWVYSGPVRELTIPQGHRLDYPTASCNEAGSSGVYGPLKITRSGPVSVWFVPGETRCPPHSAGAR